MNAYQITINRSYQSVAVFSSGDEATGEATDTMFLRFQNALDASEAVLFINTLTDAGYSAGDIVQVEASYAYPSWRPDLWKSNEERRINGDRARQNKAYSRMRRRY